MDMKLLTVELDEAGDLVEMHMDKAGAIYLRDLLTDLIEADQNTSLHLMSPDWGGDELCADQQNLSDDVSLVNHLKLLYWSE
jgi:hypothetical protein